MTRSRELSPAVGSGDNSSLRSDATEADRLRQADADITAALKRPMSNTERALLVADRRDIRAALARTESLP